MTEQKKITFSNVILHMIRQAKERGKPSSGGGDPNTSDSIITKYLPKLTETILEVLSEEPFQGNGSITQSNGVSFKFKGE